jgi:hypothetical protein
MNDFGVDFLKNQLGSKAEAEDWFQKRISGQSQNFTKLQRGGLGDLIRKPFLVFFHSSEDELITTDLISKNWGKQSEALRRLIMVMAKHKELNLVVRMHPNLVIKSKEENRIWTNIGHELENSYDWITILSPTNETNSYDLIRESVGVITVGSTIGVEAAFLKKKSILIGRAFHEEMDITFNPSNENELQELLNFEPSNEMLETKANNAMKYAVFHKFAGTRFKYFEHYFSNNRLNYRNSDFLINYPVICSILMRIDIFVKERFTFRS